MTKKQDDLKKYDEIMEVQEVVERPKHVEKYVGITSGKPIKFMRGQGGICTINGIDVFGSPIDVSTGVTFTVTSSDPEIVTVDLPLGTTFRRYGVKVGTATIKVVGTWDDESKNVGPFEYDIPCEVVSDDPVALFVDPGLHIPNE